MPGNSEIADRINKQLNKIVLENFYKERDTNFQYHRSVAENTRQEQMAHAYAVLKKSIEENRKRIGVESYVSDMINLFNDLEDLTKYLSKCKIISAVTDEMLAALGVDIGYMTTVLVSQLYTNTKPNDPIPPISLDFNLNDEGHLDIGKMRDSISLVQSEDSNLKLEDLDLELISDSIEEWLNRNKISLKLHQDQEYKLEHENGDPLMPQELAKIFHDHEHGLEASLKEEYPELKFIIHSDMAPAPVLGMR